MASALIQDINDAASQQDSIVKLPKVAAPFTTVQKRASVTDFSRDLLPRMGVDRVQIQACMEVQGEAGPNGEQVFKPINDIHDQVRFYGVWTPISIDATGQCTSCGTAAIMEVTFYGTGLNILVVNDGNAGRSLKAGVDGAAVGAELTSLAGNSNILNSRGYSPNQVIVAASGLSLGMHTVKLLCTAMRIYGFETVVVSGSSPSVLQLPSGTSFVGGKKLSKTSLTVDSYNSNFESGTLGTRGGHVVVYQKSDGSIGKAVQPTDAAAAFMSSANHANESVIRSYGPREFSGGRTDDFSAPGTILRTFNLEDNCTSLTTNSGTIFTYSGFQEGLITNLINDQWTLTFVGTGIDLLFAVDSSFAGRTFHILVDGTQVATNTTAAQNVNVMKIASGLPYGSHTVRLVETGAGNASPPALVRAIVYGPSKPSIPAGAVELADYYVVANYSSANTDSFTNGHFVSAGVISKSVIREATYQGASWTTGNGSTNRHGWSTSGSTTGDFVTFTFYGTGFEFGAAISTTATVIVAIDGTNYTGAATTTLTSGSSSWTPGTSTWQLANNERLTVTGLALGLHTVKFSKGATGPNFQPIFFDAITPIHAPKPTLRGIEQAPASVGNCTIGDSRNFTSSSVKTLTNWGQAVGITSGPTTNSGSFLPVPDMICVVKTNGNPIEISYEISLSTNTVNGGAELLVTVDGNLIAASDALAQFGATGVPMAISNSCILPVAAGIHTVQLFWGTAGPANTVTASSTRRVLKAREIT